MSHRIYPINETVFNIIDTEAKAYWLGFLYADGNVSKEKTYVTLVLKRDDKKHVERFRDFLESTHKILDLSRLSERGTMVKMSRYSVYSRLLCEALIKQGCMPAKTFLLKFPSTKKIPTHLIHHFIRGYFDGDGSICLTMPGKYLGNARCLISFVGTSHMLHNIAKHIGRAIGKKSQHVVPHRSIFQMGFSGKHQCQKVSEYLYKDATIWLDRKKEKVDILMSLPRIIGNGKDHCMAKEYRFWDTKKKQVLIIKNLSLFVREHRHDGYNYTSLVLLHQGKNKTHHNLVKYVESESNKMT